MPAVKLTAATVAFALLVAAGDAAASSAQETCRSLMEQEKALRGRADEDRKVTLRLAKEAHEACLKPGVTLETRVEAVLRYVRISGRSDEETTSLIRAVEEEIALVERERGVDSPLLPGLLLQWSGYLQQSGRLAERQLLVDRAHDITVKAYGLRSEQGVRSLLTLSHVASTSRHYALAESLARQALTIARDMKCYDCTGQAIVVLNWVLRDQGGREAEMEELDELHTQLITERRRAESRAKKPQ